MKTEIISVGNKANKSIVKLTEEFVSRFCEFFFDPDVNILVFDESIIDIGDEKVGFACYLPEVESVFMSANRDPVLDQVTYYSWPQIYIGFLAHELVHVEQKRKNKPIQERGVRVRSRTFMDVCGYDPVWI